MSGVEPNYICFNTYPTPELQLEANNLHTKK